MVTKKFVVLKSQFDFIAKRLLSMVGVVGSIWVLGCNYSFFVFGFITRYIIRFQADDRRNRNRNQNRVDFLQLYDQVDVRNREEPKSYGLVEKLSATNADLYEFRSGNGISGYIEQPKAASFTVQELYVGKELSNSLIYEAFDQEKTEAKTEDADDQQQAEGNTEDGDDQEETEAVDDGEKTEDFAETVYSGEVLEKTVNDYDERCDIVEHPFRSFSFGNFLVGKSEISTSSVEYPESPSYGEHDPSDNEVLHESIVKNFASLSHSEAESVTSGKNLEVGSITYDFMVGRNDEQKLKMNMEDFRLCEFRIPNGKEDVSSDQVDSFDFESSDDEFIELPNPQIQNLSPFEDHHEHEDELIQKQEPKPRNDTEEIRLQEKKLESNPDDEDEDGLQWEHDDIIEQLKTEIGIVRNGRLSTILEEESESTNTMENPRLKPLIIDEKLEFKDQMAEIQKVHKRYADKMRKLDILNNQTMHAIGFLQLKYQSKARSIQQSSTFPIVKSVLPQNRWRCKAEKQATAHDPVPKLASDLHKDFELVYVGQVCLSWEILNWQHRKAQELQQYDHTQGSIHQYNQVAAEFQLFQVLLQRFIEDDPFQGTRVQHYVKNRCVLRALLQVPSVKDDRMNDKKRVVIGDEDSIILSEILEKIIEESMRIFFEFIRKDERNVTLKGVQEDQVEHNDLQLLMDVRKNLQKNEKKLKDIQRSRNCVVKKFQKHQDKDGVDGIEDGMLIAQVELRLVSRVLNMPKLKTEQLVWCHEKLDKINFFHRKVHIEPSFLLFPC